ncbi:MAG: glycerol-3-phosphate dehydrogenase [Hyphomicrobiales bacterium]|nr:glycerol-3-phosphate dehydrogenase [Hyphomicrobiales bacterium]MCP5371321.1 glycerol-3-phosphate dehydrogenase [Hyphomicrobiales bacterium]
MNQGVFDIAIIGGGINGCGIARDAAGRGLSVFLAEQRDLASGTSSASTKLIHGGLRYLEHREFGLVRESLMEREVLWAMAPHIIWPLRFVLPHHRALRPAWLIRLGLFLYDHLGGRRLLPASRTLDLRRDAAGAPLKDAFTRAFEYSDCWVDDARLVVLTAMDAARLGAEIRVRTEVLSATRADGLWRVEVRDRETGVRRTVAARVLVNAAGPWVSQVLDHRVGLKTRAHARLVKGSHIVVPRLFDHDRAYIFQNADQRVVFAIPYQDDFTLIGTTDVDFEGDPATVAISDAEVAYLCASASDYFQVPVTPESVAWSYSGIRPLYDDGGAAAQEITRDYVLDLQGGGDAPAVLNIFGGKITTYRHLAEEALDKLRPHLPAMGGPWTRGSHLPGGDFDPRGFAALAGDLTTAFPALDPGLLRRLARAYGTRAREILDGAAGAADLGRHFGAGLYAREVAYLVRREWAVSAEDILWRRTKLGLRLSPDRVRALDAWLAEQRSRASDPAA